LSSTITVTADNVVVRLCCMYEQRKIQR